MFPVKLHLMEHTKCRYILEVSAALIKGKIYNYNCLRQFFRLVPGHNYVKYEITGCFGQTLKQANSCTALKEQLKPIASLVCHTN